LADADVRASGRPECDPSGYGEGETFIGLATVTTDGNGDAGFSTTLAGSAPNGHFVTATATDPAGNTSEFSLCRVSCLATRVVSGVADSDRTELACDTLTAEDYAISATVRFEAGRQIALLDGFRVLSGGLTAVIDAGLLPP
jgi:hypothetical protein